MSQVTSESHQNDQLVHHHHQQQQQQHLLHNATVDQHESTENAGVEGSGVSSMGWKMQLNVI